MLTFKNNVLKYVNVLIFRISAYFYFVCLICFKRQVRVYGVSSATALKKLISKNVSKSMNKWVSLNITCLQVSLNITKLD